MRVVVPVFAILWICSATAQTNFVTIDGDVTPMGDWDDEFCLEDVDVCEDIPTFLDAKYACIASNFATVQPADQIYLRFDFDEISFPGMNTGDACWLLDTDDPGNGFVDYAVCFTIVGTMLTATNAYTCDDMDVDNCTNATVDAGASPMCQLDIDAPEQKACGMTPDAAVECSVPVANLGLSSSMVVLTFACSFPSEVPNSSPGDCVNNAGSPFIIDIDTGINIPVELLRFSVD